MNDYEYCFMQDVREKKRTATGAFHKATRGKRAFTVHNPSDYLSKKELKAMSGEVREFTMKPMTWEELKAMPEASQKSYLQLLIDEYGASYGKLVEMTGVCRSTITRLFKELGVTPRKQRASTTAEERRRWNEFISGANPPCEITPEPIQKKEESSPSYAGSIMRSVCSVTLESGNKGDLIRDLIRLMESIEGQHFAVKIVIDGKEGAQC